MAICEVCGKPDGEYHKHKLDFCKVYNRKTVHVIAFAGSPGGWGCKEHSSVDHYDKCGKKLSDESIKIAKAFGVHSVTCDDCMAGKLPPIIPPVKRYK